MTPLHPPQGKYRINMVDQRGTVSFLAPSHAPKMLTAVIARGGNTVRDVLESVAGYDEDWANRVKGQLALFDEFNVASLAPEWRQVVLIDDHDSHPAFRVIDEETRARSNEAAALGLIVFNLSEHRIIQVKNVGPVINRQGVGRYREDGVPSNRTYRYTLPDNWLLVP